jgi:hypothetical protein
MSLESLRVNAPAVTSETFDDEVVIVNFDNGKYHSVQGIGVDIWLALMTGATMTDLEAGLRDRFTDLPADFRDVLDRFVTSLRDEQLVVAASPSPAPPADAVHVSNGRRPFVAPALTTFSDMQELLWLDPIHEVDESGWPTARAEDGGSE